MSKLKPLLESEMNRRQFLGILGASALVVTGVSGILAGLSKLGNKSGGYGSSAYGGGTENSTQKRRRL